MQVFKDYPYLLPCLVSAFLTVVSVIAGYIFLKEVRIFILGLENMYSYLLDP